MSELDDLAAANEARQQVSVKRRKPAGQGGAAVILQQPHFHAAGKPRSSFAAGYMATFGVIAALLTIAIALLVWAKVSQQMDQQARERDAAAAKQQQQQQATPVTPSRPGSRSGMFDFQRR